MIENWSAIAFNQAPDSANEIHGDKIAQQYGFKGGLVPGVTVSAYLLHPAVVGWGEKFLESGRAHVRVVSPLYDEESFEVRISEQSDDRYEAALYRPDGTLSASATAELPVVMSPPPARRGDPVMSDVYKAPQATPAHWSELQAGGCQAVRYHWGSAHNMQTYLRDSAGMPALLKGNQAFANMSYLLGTSNWILAANAYMNPWVHLETTSQNYLPVPADTTLIAEMAVQDFYEKRGHQFVDVDVSLFDESDDRCVTAISLRAIYRLRGA